MKIAKMLLIFWVTALISMPVIAEPDEATKHFLKGQMLLTNNCGECEGASRKGLEDIAELKLADSKGKGPYMQQAIDTLNQYGHKAEADKWRREVSS